MGIIFQLINYNHHLDESSLAQQSLVTAFSEYGYIVSTEVKGSDDEYDIYISKSSDTNDGVKLILASESDIAKNDISYYESANKCFNVNGDVAAIIVTGEVTRKTGIIDMNFYFSPMVYVHLFNTAEIHMLTSYLIRRYGGTSKIIYEIGEL